MSPQRLLTRSNNSHDCRHGSIRTNVDIGKHKEGMCCYGLEVASASGCVNA
jgi:hypothetical protein